MSKVLAKVMPLATVLSSVFAVIYLLPHLVGYLINNAGITPQVAFAIVALIESGGLDAAALIYPVILPFLGTIQVVIAIIGISALAGW